jgi:hypothetical protein
VRLAGALDRDLIRASVASRFSVSAMVDRYIALYRSVLAETAA